MKWDTLEKVIMKFDTSEKIILKFDTSEKKGRSGSRPKRKDERKQTHVLPQTDQFGAFQRYTTIIPVLSLHLHPPAHHQPSPLINFLTCIQFEFSKLEFT